MEKDCGKHKVETSSFGFSKTNNLLNVFNKLKEDIEILKKLVDTEENGDIEELSESVKGLEENVRSLITDKSQSFENGFREYSGNVGNSFITQTGDSINGEWGFDYKIPYYETDNEIVPEETINDAIALGPIIKSLSRCISYLMNEQNRWFRNGSHFYDGNTGLSIVTPPSDKENEKWDFSYEIPAYQYAQFEPIEEDNLSDSTNLGSLLQKMSRCISYLMKETDNNFYNGFVNYDGDVGRSNINYFANGTDDPDDPKWSFQYNIPSYKFNEDGEEVTIPKQTLNSDNQLGPLLQKMCSCIAYLMQNKTNSNIDNFITERNANFNCGFKAYKGAVGSATLNTFDMLLPRQLDEYKFKYTFPSYEFNGKQIPNITVDENSRLNDIIPTLCRCVTYLMEKDSAKGSE